jgi:formyltetrahydrofolate hydrolase
LRFPFHHVEIIRDRKEEGEDAQLKIFHRYRVDVVIMARYIQVLSPNFLGSIGVPVILIFTTVSCRPFPGQLLTIKRMPEG